MYNVKNYKICTYTRLTSRMLDVKKKSNKNTKEYAKS
uniref:Uncharacterized protein n=1 Tax=Rhizophora mucronata TaxID=61149 RepID=A0A2P2KLV6_RHIMU